MIYQLLEQHLKNQLLDRTYNLPQFQLMWMHDNKYVDTLDYEYELLINDHQNLVVQQYSFEYNYQLDTNQLHQLSCNIEQANNSQVQITIDLINNNSLPINLIKKVIIKQCQGIPKLTTHQIYLITAKTQKQEVNFTNLTLIERPQLVVYKEPKEPKQPKQSKEPKVKVEKIKRKIKILNLEQIQRVKDNNENYKQEINVNKQLFKEDHQIKQMVQKLEIPKDWKKTSREFSETHKKIWDIKYYEKLILLTESISKKFFYQHIMNIEEEYQKKLIKFALPPDLNDPGITKRRKIYSKDIVCSLIE